MKRFAILTTTVLTIAVISCQPLPDGAPKPLINTDQLGLYNLLGAFKGAYDSAPSELGKNDIKSLYEKNIDSYLTDTLHGCLNKFRLHIDKVDYMPWRGIIALTFKGNFDDVEYWSEQHFEDEAAMKESGLYKFLSGLKEGSDTTISLIYMTRFELGPIYGARNARIEVIPVPDSIATAFITERQLPSNFKK